MTIIVTADIHLHEGPLEEYRWETFDTLIKEGRSRKATDILILGDLTAKKSGHDEEMVNRMIREMIRLSREFHVTILGGNHDYRGTDSRSAEMFFRFLDMFPGIDVITEIAERRFGKNKALFLPHTSYPAEDWKNLEINNYDYIFFHQAFIGAMASDHYEIDRGADPKRFSGFEGIALGGDIHTGCKVGNLQYVGAPCRMNMGDNFTPRIMCLENNTIEIIETGNIHKYLVEVRDTSDLEKLKSIPEGAIIKIRAIGTSTFVEEIRKKVRVDEVRIDQKHIEIKPASSILETWKEYCKMNNKSPEVRSLGTELIK